MDYTELKHGDLIFYKVTPQSHWFARIIAASQLLRKEGKTSTHYSHVAMLDYNKDQILESYWPKTRLIEMDWEYPGIEVWRVKDLNSLQRHAALTWAYCHLGRPYDISQLLYGLFTWSSAYTCTEFVVDAYRHVGIDLAADAGKVIGPNELITDKIERII